MEYIAYAGEKQPLVQHRPSPGMNSTHALKDVSVQIFLALRELWMHSATQVRPKRVLLVRLHDRAVA